MIRLSLLQFRVQAVIAGAAMAAFAVLLAVSGPHLASLYNASGIIGCKPGTCAQLASNFLQGLYNAGTYWVLYLLGVMLILLTPFVIGLFWGAPLIARELETETSALAWSQSITRGRWLAVKLTVAGLAAMVLTEGLSLMQTWWAAPIGRAVGLGAGGTTLAMGQFTPLVFVTHGITPLGYAALGFILGVTAGALIRRTIPAMAVTLAIFTVVQIAMPLWIRPHLFPAHHTTIAIGSDLSFSNGPGPQGYFTLTTGPGLAGYPGAWVVSSGAVDAAGHPISMAPAACIQAVANGSGQSGLDCLASHGIRIGVNYWPAGRYWLLQWVETGIYLAVSLALAGYCFHWLTRRLS
jgi:ABC-type transport system involved in multi-copper enzyme maturation permease subunit